MYAVNFDSDCAVLQTDGDGGDSAARTGMYYTAMAIYFLQGWDMSAWPGFNTTCWNKARQALIKPDGTVLRYSKAPYNDPKDVSRDQTMPMVIACIFNNNIDEVRAIWNATKARHFLFQNGDLCGPQDVAIFDMALGNGFFDSSEIFLGGCQIFGSAFVRCAQARRDFDDVGDDVNLVQYLLCLKKQPTWPLKKAIAYYANNRPCWAWPAGTDPKQTAKIVQGNGVQYAFDRYFRPETHANPMNELYRPIISTYFTP